MQAALVVKGLAIKRTLVHVSIVLFIHQLIGADHNTRLYVAGLSHGWVYCVRECYHETIVYTLELDNSQLRRSIILDHAHNGVTLTQDNCCDWCIFIASQNITRHLSSKTEYHASVRLLTLLNGIDHRWPITKQLKSPCISER